MVRQILQVLMLLIFTGAVLFGISAIKYSLYEAGWASIAMFVSLVPLGFMHDTLRILERIETALNDKGE